MEFPGILWIPGMFQAGLEQPEIAGGVPGWDLSSFPPKPFHGSVIPQPLAPGAGKAKPNLPGGNIPRLEKSPLERVEFTRSSLGSEEPQSGAVPAGIMALEQGAGRNSGSDYWELSSLRPEWAPDVGWGIGQVKILGWRSHSW